MISSQMGPMMREMEKVGEFTYRASDVGSAQRDAEVFGRGLIAWMPAWSQRRTRMCKCGVTQALLAAMDVFTRYLFPITIGVDWIEL